MALVTVTFETDHPMAMMVDWPSELGLLDPERMAKLGIREAQVEVVSTDGSPE